MLNTKDVETRGAAYTTAICPVCGGSLQRLSTYRQVFLLDSILLSKRLLKDSLQCTGCRRRFNETEVRSSQVSVKNFELDNGAKVAITKTATLQGNRQTTTVTDYSEVFPKTMDDRLMAVTMAAIATVLVRYNEKRSVREHEVFLYLAGRYESYRTDMLAAVAEYEQGSLREVTDKVIAQFRQAERSLTVGNLTFILRQTIKMVPDEFMLDSDEEDLFAAFLKIIGTTEFEARAMYLGLRKRM
jgi:hypothetical protein